MVDAKARIRAVLEAHGAESILESRRWGVLTFRLSASAEADTDCTLWFLLCGALKGIHPNCTAWSYTKLDLESTGQDRHGALWARMEAALGGTK